jgi:ABC-2 type transport system permease protein
MIEGVSAVVWKEFKETFAAKRGRSAALLLAVPILLLGAFLPWQAGTAWLNSPVTMLMWAWLPAFMAVSIVADSFAGERERHTLETLLASRLADRAILFGKISLAVLYSWGMTLAGMAAALLTVNLLYGQGNLLLYSADTLVIGVTFSLIVAALVATGGCLISLRAPTIRQAQQTISLLFMVPWIAIIFGFQLVPEEWTAGLASSVSGMGIAGVLGIVEVLLVVLAGLAAAVLVRFKRAKLISA